MEKQPLSSGALLGGFLLSLFVGGFGTLFTLIGVVAGANQSSKTTSLTIIAVPGLFFALIALLAPKNGWAQGLFIGGCVVALLGGACGAAIIMG